MPIATIRETSALYILEICGVEVRCWGKNEWTATAAPDLAAKINDAAAAARAS